MSADLLKTAWELVEAANKSVDKNMPDRLASIVKQHAVAGVGAAWIPIPGASIAAGAAAVWGMYFRINSELNLSLSENVVKSIASGVATNLAAYLSPKCARTSPPTVGGGSAASNSGPPGPAKQILASPGDRLGSLRLPGRVRQRTRAAWTPFRTLNVAC